MYNKNGKYVEQNNKWTCNIKFQSVLEVEYITTPTLFSFYNGIKLIFLYMSPPSVFTQGNPFACVLLAPNTSKTYARKSVQTDKGPHLGQLLIQRIGFEQHKD